MMFADYGECFFMGKINEFENVKDRKKKKRIYLIWTFSTP
tara:strand:+ start:561 stop:680 length:120 start_codon:yes stop_codon:yes gene_type:complete